jgi:hypothetical protein
MIQNLNDPKAARRPKPTPEMVIAYLSYAVDDVRALSAQSTSLLEGAIAVLMQEAGPHLTRRKGGSAGKAAGASRHGTVAAEAEHSSN